MIEIIPSIELIDGKCVRLTQGDYNSQKVYNENPVEVAKQFEANGIRHLHVVDLDGAASHHVVNYRMLDKIAGSTSLTINFGGGLKSDEDLVIAFENGAQTVNIGSVAIKEPTLFEKWLHQYGSEKIILEADVKEGHVVENGWKEESALPVESFLKEYTQRGVSKVLCTDVSRDGMLEGPSIELYEDIIQQNPKLHVIARGGVSSIDDIYRLEEAGVPAVVFGKALYEGTIVLKDLLPFI